MEKAKNIKRENIRKQRAPLFDALDVAYMRAVESGDTKKQKEIADNKQILRDATEHPDIDAAKTLENLKLVDPLKGLI